MNIVGRILKMLPNTSREIKYNNCLIVGKNNIKDMVLKEGDKVILHDVHSKYDGETGTINGIMETMFGSSNYTIKFENGQESGIGEGALELLVEEDTEE